MYLDKFKLTGRIAVVTGAARGIGLAAVEALAEAGATVVLTDMNPDLLAAATQAMAAKGHTVDSEVLDVTDAKAVQAVHDAILSRHGRVDVLVNNAGIAISNHPAETMADEVWNKVIDVNLNGVFYGMKYQIAAMLASGGGAIVNMSSILGSVGWANAAPYVAAKHALVGLTRTAALEYAGQDVRVNAVGPAFIDTPLLAGFDEAARDWLIAKHPAGRLGRATEVSALVLFLLSEQAGFITGSYHLVDGGYTAL